MNENDNLLPEESVQSVDSSIEVSDTVNEDEVNEEKELDPTEQSEVGSNSPSETEEEIEEKPSSTVIQVTEDENSVDGYTVDELDVRGLNDFIQYENELRSVNPTSNDYYTFISGDVADYFSGIMAQYPLNDYKACHLRHWIQNTQYSSYYDDYYYLWYDYPNENVVEIYKANNSNQYVVSNTTQRDLSATIVYGSGVGESDLRKGVSYVQEMALLSVCGVCIVLYILHAIFKHLAR